MGAVLFAVLVTIMASEAVSQAPAEAEPKPPLQLLSKVGELIKMIYPDLNLELWNNFAGLVKSVRSLAVGQRSLSCPGPSAGVDEIKMHLKNLKPILELITGQEGFAGESKKAKNEKLKYRKTTHMIGIPVKYI